MDCGFDSKAKCVRKTRSIFQFQNVFFIFPTMYGAFFLKTTTILDKKIIKAERMLKKYYWNNHLL
jgi:hypothetical protein